MGSGNGRCVPCSSRCGFWTDFGPDGDMPKDETRPGWADARGTGFRLP